MNNENLERYIKSLIAKMEYIIYSDLSSDTMAYRNWKNGESK